MSRANKYDRRITIMRPGPEIDGEYGPQPGEPTVFAARVPARRWDERPRNTENDQGALHRANKPSKIVIRWLPGVTPDMFIIMHDENDSKYQIKSWPAEIGRREELEFAVEAYATNGGA